MARVTIFHNARRIEMSNGRTEGLPSLSQEGVHGMNMIRRLSVGILATALVATGIVVTTATPALASSICDYTRNGYGFVESPFGTAKVINVWPSSSGCNGASLGRGQIGVSGSNYEVKVWDSVVDGIGFTFRMWYTDGVQYHFSTQGERDQAYVNDVPKNQIGSPEPNNFWLEVSTTTNSNAYTLPS